MARSYGDFFRPLDYRDFLEHHGRYLFDIMDADFLERFLNGNLSTEEARYIGFREQTSRPELIERTVLEVEDVYIDNVTRNVIQPVIVTTIQPVVNEVLNGRTETKTLPTRYETETLAGKTEHVHVPDTVVNYIPQITEEYKEERTETYFDAVTQRDIHQPIHRTIIQPVEIRKVNPKVETVTNPTRYETVRASLVVLNIGTPCDCN